MSTLTIEELHERFQDHDYRLAYDADSDTTDNYVGLPVSDTEIEDGWVHIGLGEDGERGVSTTPTDTIILEDGTITVLDKGEVVLRFNQS